MASPSSASTNVTTGHVGSEQGEGNRHRKPLKMPGNEKLNIAIDWLRSNEGTNGEADACVTVANWIEHEERERYLRHTARVAGVSIARLRRKIAEQTKATQT